MQDSGGGTLFHEASRVVPGLSRASHATCPGSPAAGGLEYGVALEVIAEEDRIPVVHCSRFLEPPGVASAVLPAAGMNPSRVFRVNPSSPATTVKVSPDT